MSAIMNVLTRAGFIVVSGAAVIFFQFQSAGAGESPDKLLSLLSPMQSVVVVSRKPVITFRFSQPVLEEGLIVMLDDSDISQLVTAKGDTFSYMPIRPIAAGLHRLVIFATMKDGRKLEQEFAFTTRHSEAFEEYATENNLSLTYNGVLHRNFSYGEAAESTSDAEFAYGSFDSYLATDSSVREGKWNSTARAKLRYYDQNAALQKPEEKGLSTVDFLISSSYTGERYNGNFLIGDTTINESVNTLDYLTRRGVNAEISSKDFTLRGFSLLGEENNYDIDDAGFQFKLQ